MTLPAAVRFIYLGRDSVFARQIQETLLSEANRTAPGLQSRVQFLHASSQKETLHELRTVPCHGLLLEIDGRKSSRQRFCSTLRARYPGLCIVAVGEERHHRQSSVAFDGFVQNPLLPEQARPILQLLLSGSADAKLRVGPIRLDRRTRTVTGPVGRKKLPPKLCDLLSLLMENAGDTVKRKKIMQAVWQTEYLEDTRTLDVHIRWLRERIEPDPSHPQFLETVRGEGYRLNV